MAQNLRSLANEHLNNLRVLSESHKSKSDGVIHHYSEVGKCYAKDPTDPQLQEYNRQANEIMDELDRLRRRLETFDLLKAATSSLHPGDELLIHPDDMKEVIKLRTSDLELRGFDNVVAEKVSGDLFNLNLGSLGKHIGGIVLTEKSSARRLRSV